MSRVQGLRLRIQRGIRVHLSLAALLLPAIQPLLTADFTCGYGNTFHLWRAVQAERFLRQGVILSRWAPDMALGYGYPLFNFVVPASAYGAALLHLLGLSWSWALNVALVAGWILSAYAMYVFTRDLFGSDAAIVAAVLYAYAPYHAYDVLYRGSLSEASAWLFPPLILWALRRADGRMGFAVAASACAGLVLTHNSFALLFAPLLAAYLVVVAHGRGKEVAFRGGLALLLGLALSAFFWLPALADLRFVHSERLTGAWVFQYTNCFLPPGQVFAPPRTADPSLINDLPARGVGLVPVLLGVAGLLALRDRRARIHVIFFGLALCLYACLILPVSRPVWDALPLLQRVQFPWRLAGPAILCAAALAAAFTGCVADGCRPVGGSLRASLLTVALAAAVVIGSLGWYYPDHCSPPEDTSAAGMIAWEQRTATFGSTASGEFLPAWVEEMPQKVHLGTERLDEAALPEGAELLEAEYGVNRARLTVESPAGFRARYLAFYFPGWRAAVDGDPVPIHPTSLEGLIAFDVPAGRHTIDVRFGETPIRLLAGGLSLMGLVALAVSLVLPVRWVVRDGLPRLPLPGRTWPALAAAVLVVVLKVAVVDRIHTPLRRPNLEEGQLRRVDVSADVTFGDEFILLGYDALPKMVAGDGRFTVTTYWRALHPGGPDYGVTLSLVDDRGHRWNGSEIRPVRWHRVPPPVWEWPPKRYAVSALMVPVLSGTAPGTYTVELVAFDAGTLAPLTAHDGDGRAIGPSLDLGQITVVAPHRPVALDELRISHRLDTRLGPLTLLGADFDRDEAAPGDPVRLTTFWRAGEQPAEDLALHLSLAASGGAVAAQYDLPPTAAWHPTSSWRQGDVWRGQHTFFLPASLGSGDYTWSLRLAGGDAHEVGRLSVSAPVRSFTAPSFSRPISGALGSLATLVGFDISAEAVQPGDTLAVTLVWRADAGTHESYHVFLHLLAPDGSLVAQSDGVPANWSRPTTGWLPGEYVTDGRTLALPADSPAGEYVLLAGLYVPGGERLRTPCGADGLQLTTLRVAPE